MALALLAGVSAVYWCVVAFHVLRDWLAHPTARAGLSLPAAPARVGVVVPAHNEAHCIAGLIASLRAQTHADLRVALALDRCTDATARVACDAIAGDDRFEIVEIDACPEGWAGKTHAVHEGLRRAPSLASADMLAFLDADTVLDPECLRACVTLARSRGVGMLSLVSTLTFDRWFERVVQPACALELVRQYPLARASRDAGRRAFANGQCMVFEASAYRSLGGHEAVRDALLEDIALARLARDHGVRALVVLADGLLTCRMYESWAAFRRGWARIFTEAATRRDDRLTRSALLVLATGLISPGASAIALLAVAPPLLAGHADSGALAGAALGALGLLAWIIGLGLVCVRGSIPLWTIPAFPLGAALCADILRHAARDLRTGTPTEWGGRSYARQRRTGEPRRPTR